MNDFPLRWEPGYPAKGLWLPDKSIVTWQVEEGHPTHDQGAKLMHVSLLDCEALFIREDGCIEQAGISNAHTVDDFQRAVLLYDSRLWVTDDGWDFS
jgi:hypothetical protein